jgi:hypothetical protein
MKQLIWSFKYCLAWIQIGLIVMKLFDWIVLNWWWVMSPLIGFNVVMFCVGFANGFAGARK